MISTQRSIKRIVHILITHPLFCVYKNKLQVVGRNSTVLFLKLHISNLSSIPVSQGKPVTARQAIEKLKKSAAGNDNKLGFEIELSPGQHSAPHLLRIHTANEIVHQPDDDSQKNCSQTQEDDGLSDGGIAAIAVLLLILGIGLGVVGTLLVLYTLHCVRSKSTGRKDSAVSYKKQIDDVNTETS